MRVLGTVLASALMTSVAWAERAPLLRVQKTGWITKFDRLSFSTSSHWEDSDEKRRNAIKYSDAIRISNSIRFYCEENGKYGFSWAFNRKTTERTDKIDLRDEKVIIYTDSNSRYRYLDMSVQTGIDRDPGDLSTWGFSLDESLPPSEFVSLIRDFYSSDLVTIQLESNPKIRLVLGMNIFSTYDLKPSERPKEALSLAYSVCRAFLRR